MTFSIYLLLFVFAVSLSSCSVINRDAFDLTIVHFNDFHARFEETSPTSMKCAPEYGACIGGFPRLYTAINNIKQRTPDALVLNAGDDFQGTLWYNILRWNVTKYFMNMLPLDASTIGNHEFDDGISGLVPYMKSLRAPVLVSNIDDSLEPTFQGLYNKSIIIERKGRKIGIIGVISEKTNELSKTEKLKFTSEIQAVKTEAEKLANQGVNIIIVLSHCGLANDREIAKLAGPHIDIVVGGHSHSLLYNGKPPNGVAEDSYPAVVTRSDGSKVPIVQAASYTKYLGNINFIFDSQGKITSWSGNPIYLDSTIKRDENILQLMKPYKTEIDVLGKKRVGSSSVLLDKSKCAYGECNLGNFINDVYVKSFIDKAEKGSWTYTAVSIMNQGGVRTDINKGDILYEDLIVALPFANSLYTFDIKGKHILEALEHSVSVINGTYSYRMLQVSGLKIVYNVTKPAGQRVQNVSILCSKCETPRYYPLDLETIYRISTQSFVANGGDGFTSLSQNKMNVKVWGTDVDILQKYLEKHSPVTATVDNRIIMVK